MPGPQSGAPAADPNGRQGRQNVVLAIVALLAVLAATGWLLLRPATTATSAQGGSGSADKPARLTQVQAFRTAGDGICTSMNAATQALGAFPKGAAAQVSFVHKEVAYQARAVKELKALHVPAAAAPAMSKVYAQEAALATIGAKLIKALKGGNHAAASDLEGKINARATSLSAAYDAAGLPLCGS